MRARWRSYQIYWHDTARNTLETRELPLIAASPEILNPGPLELYDIQEPLEFYLSDGRSLSRNVEFFELQYSGAGSPVRIKIGSASTRYGREGQEKLSFESEVLPRN